MSNPWESLAQGVQGIQRVPLKGKALHNATHRRKKQMAAHGVTTVAALKERQIMRDNSKPTAFNSPVGRGFVFSTLEAQS